jgi:hypothetical protein
VFQALGRGTINPILLATVNNVFERVMAGQIILSPSGVDNPDYWEDMTRDLDGQGMASAGHRTRREGTADAAARMTMVEHAAADPDALDRYFAEMADVGDQDTGDE